MDAGDSSYHYNQSFELDDHELKVKKFLEMGKDEGKGLCRRILP
jgi:hypothetical protein